jgi:hypothetical protein
MPASFLLNFYQGVNLQKFYDNSNMLLMSTNRQKEKERPELIQYMDGYSHWHQSYPPLPERGHTFQEAKI